MIDIKKISISSPHGHTVFKWPRIDVIDIVSPDSQLSKMLLRPQRLRLSLCCARQYASRPLTTIDMIGDHVYKLDLRPLRVGSFSKSTLTSTLNIFNDSVWSFLVSTFATIVNRLRYPSAPTQPIVLRPKRQLLNHFPRTSRPWERPDCSAYQHSCIACLIRQRGHRQTRHFVTVSAHFSSKM